MDGREYRRAQRTVQWLLTIAALVWATQTLVAQWGFGAEPPQAAEERFVPAQGGPAGQAATLELRNEATVIGGEVKLRHVARWSNADKAALEPLGDLVLMRLAEKTPFQSISLEQVKSILHDAGANLAFVHFSGSTSCTVARGDVEFDQTKALEQWAQARSEPLATPATRPLGAPAAVAAASPAGAAPAPPPAPAAEAAADRPRTLRELLLADLADRTGLPLESLQVRFDARDETWLRLVEPHFSFDIESRRIAHLGDVSWNVSIATGKDAKPITITAFARAWQNQLITVRPLAARQMLRKEDLVEKRTLVDDLGPENLLQLEQVVGQQLARDLPVGTVLTGRMVEAIPLVHQGQLITVMAEAGSVQIKTVAEARETGVYGQTIRARKPGQDDEFNVVVTGPQVAKLSSPAGDGKVATTGAE